MAVAYVELVVSGTNAFDFVKFGRSLEGIVGFTW